MLSTESTSVSKVYLHIRRGSRLSSERVGVDGHILYSGFSQRSERLFIDGQFLQFIQCFQAVDNPTCWREQDVSCHAIIMSISHNTHLLIIQVAYFPNTVYFMSRWGCLAYVRKNWEPFVLGPLFAIETTPRTLCLNKKKAGHESHSDISWSVTIHLVKLPTDVGEQAQSS